MARSLSSPRMASSNMPDTLLSSRYIARTYRADISKRYMRHRRVSTCLPGKPGPATASERRSDGGGLGFGQDDGRFGHDRTAMRAGQDQHAGRQPERPAHGPQAVDAPGQQDRSERRPGHPAESPRQLV